MHDLRYIVDNIDLVRELTEHRQCDFDFELLKELASKRIDAIHEFESTRSLQKKRSAHFAAQIKNRAEDLHLLQKELVDFSNRVKELGAQKDEIDKEIEAMLMTLPNLISDSTPRGKSESDNVTIIHVNSRPKIENPMDHITIGEKFGIIDVERAGKVSGSRFSFLRGEGAKLERALYNMMLDIHTTKHDYEEMSVPLLVNESSMFGTGQLPKFEKDLYKTCDPRYLVAPPEYYLIPTAEVPITNYYRDEIIDLQETIRFVAMTPCFRREAGGAGRDVRGLIRQHQFNKVELVKFCRQENSNEEHLSLLLDARTILDILELPYRIVELCSADLGFGAQRCFDIEVWIPSQSQYREISSCSNMGAFQARRSNIRYRDESGKLQFAHTINGSGLAVGRTLLAVLENGQQPDGTIKLPIGLRPWYGADLIG
jgi:seryl-tRNA synthetase